MNFTQVKLFTLFAALIFSISAHSFTTQLDEEMFIKQRDLLQKVMLSFEKSHPQFESFEVEGEFSYQQRIQFLDMMDLFINNAHASYSSLCFFGGWLSKRVRGKCKPPWKFQNERFFKTIKPTYNSDYYCGGKQYFRCNPIIFGGGKSGKGTCIKVKNINKTSHQCYQETQDNRSKHYQEVTSDPEKYNTFLNISSVIQDECNQKGFYDRACKELKSMFDAFESGDITKCVPKKDTYPSTKSIEILKRKVDKISKKFPTPKKVTPKKKVQSKKVARKASPSRSVSNAGLCSRYRQFLKAGVPKKPLQQAMTYYARNKSKFRRNKKISIADYSQHSGNKRFYTLDLLNGKVSRYKVSHGSGKVNGYDYGDPNHDGYLDRCRHKNGSQKNMTRVGPFRARNLYKSSGKSWPRFNGSTRNGMRMEGFISGVNSGAMEQGVVMHGAYYNHGGKTKMGRSYGCPAFTPRDTSKVMNNIDNGSLFYSYAPVCKSDMKKVEKHIPNWSNFCQ